MQMLLLIFILPKHEQVAEEQMALDSCFWLVSFFFNLNIKKLVSCLCILFINYLLLS